MSLKALIHVVQDQFQLKARLDVPTASTTAILGPNGSGKTTLLHALAGLLPLQDGVVQLNDTLLDKPREKIHIPPHKRKIGMVYQDLRLFPFLNLAENIAFGLRWQNHLHKARALREAHTWLEKFNLLEHAKKKPNQVSGGQAQLIAILRALAIKPTLLLLDEPLSSLDRDNQSLVRRMLAAELKHFPGVCLLISHNPLDAIFLTEKIVVLEKGEVFQEGTPAELLQNPQSVYIRNIVGLNYIKGIFQVEGELGKVITHDGGTLQTAIHDIPPNTPTILCIDPRSITLALENTPGSARNSLYGKILRIHIQDNRARVVLSTTPPLTAEITTQALRAMKLAEGRTIWATIKATDAHLQLF